MTNENGEISNAEHTLKDMSDMHKNFEVKFKKIIKKIEQLRKKPRISVNIPFGTLIGFFSGSAAAPRFAVEFKDKSGETFDVLLMSCITHLNSIEVKLWEQGPRYCVPVADYGWNIEPLLIKEIDTDEDIDILTDDLMGTLTYVNSLSETELNKALSDLAKLDLLIDEKMNLLDSSDLLAKTALGTFKASYEDSTGTSDPYIKLTFIQNDGSSEDVIKVEYIKHTDRIRVHFWSQKQEKCMSYGYDKKEFRLD